MTDTYPPFRLDMGPHEPTTTEQAAPEVGDGPVGPSPPIVPSRCSLP